MEAGDPRGYYEILGIRRTASAEEVRTAFREHAKRYHPDSTGSAADQARFHRLREAFETLRDPRLRMRYDAEGLASEQRRNGGHSAGQASVSGEAPEFVRRVWAHATSGLAGWRQQGGRATPALVILSALLVLALALLVMVWYRLDKQDRLIAELGQRLQAAPTAARAVSVDRRPEIAAGRPLYRAEIVFPRGSAEFGAVHGERVAAAVRELHDAIAALPTGERWLVLLTAHTRRVVDPGTGKAGGWELTMRRLGVVTDYLIREGVPAERVAARLNAGPVPGAPASSLPEAIQLSLLCCGNGMLADRAD